MTDSEPTSETDLPPPSAPESIGVSLRGFADETEAREFGNFIALTIRSISRYINLERLDGVTVAYDYDETLAQLDRGYPTQTTCTPDLSIIDVTRCWCAMTSELG